MTVQDEQVRDVFHGYVEPHARRLRPPMGHAALDLLDHARMCLAEASSVTTANERFAAAHLAALRAAAAVLATRAQPAGRGRSTARRSHGPRNVWELLPAVAPELTEWSAFFGANAAKRAAAQAGLHSAVSAREADDLLRDSEAFLGLVCVMLGLPYQEPLSGSVAGLSG